MALQYRFTLNYGDTSHPISEPDKWQDIKVVLDRDKQYHSLIELFEVPLVFYRSNDDHDGGMDFLLNIIQTIGLNETVTLLIQVSEDGIEFDDLCNVRLNLESYKVIDGRKLEVALLRDDAWAKFMNRVDTPVDIQSTEDLDGDEVDPPESVTVHLTGQKLRQQYVAHLDKTASFPGLPGVHIEDDFTYLQLDWNNESLSEVEEKFTLPIIDNPDFPANIFELKYAGTCRVQATIDIQDVSTDGGTPARYPENYLDLYISFNGETPIPFTKSNITGTPFLFQVTRYTIDETFEFPDPGGTIHIYGVRSTTEEFYVMYEQYNEINEVQVLNNITVTFDTVHPDSECQAFLIHDLKDAILRRICGMGIYSETLGASYTLARQYENEGCAANYTAQKGLHVRGYTLEQKQFFQSFKQAWEGIAPIFGLGLSYDEINDEPVIRIENRGFFYDVEPSLLLSWVNNIEETVDKEMVFKRVVVGYNKWQSEDIAGLDDPQTKKTYATLFDVIGTELQLLSGWIAASLAIEITRRKSIVKSEDYKFDNDVFIIALNTLLDASPSFLDSSPSVFYPELDENFTSTDNLLNPVSRYNLFLTPLRNFLRSANVSNGALQNYLDSVYKFVSGEGNYDFASEYDCNTGQKSDCPGTVCGEIGENQDISLDVYGEDLGYLHTPILYEFEHPLTWTEYKTIRDNRTKAIGVSTTDNGHEICFIKRMEYDLNKSKAKFVVWKR